MNAFLVTHFTEVLFKVAEQQTLLQLGVVTLPEVLKRRLRFIQLTQEPEAVEESKEASEGDSCISSVTSSN